MRDADTYNLLVNHDIFTSREWIPAFCSKNNYIISLRKGLMEIDVDRDPRITYLKNALLIEEDKLSQLGIRVGILGHNRSNYDIMLMPSETKEPESIEINMFNKKTVPSDKISVCVFCHFDLHKKKFNCRKKFEFLYVSGYQGTN